MHDVGPDEKLVGAGADAVAGHAGRMPWQQHDRHAGDDLFLVARDLPDLLGDAGRGPNLPRRRSVTASMHRGSRC
jgi:hypothetical protein